MSRLPRRAKCGQRLEVGSGRPVAPGRTESVGQWREMETGLNEMPSRLWRVAGCAAPKETVLRTAPESDVRSAARDGLREASRAWPYGVRRPVARVSRIWRCLAR